ncbi:NlpC/P60 family protein [Lacinutrix chionoecetis]
MKKLIFIPTLFLFCLFSYAQTYYLEGVVLDEQLSTPVEGAIVTIDGTKFTEGTDANGKFIFKQKLPDGQYGVIVEKADFDTKIFLIDVLPNKRIEVEDIKLTPNKKEIYRRKSASKKAKKEQRRKEKEEAERIAEIEKEKRRKDKDYAKELKRLEKKKRKGRIDEDDVAVKYEDNNTGAVRTIPAENNSVVSITEVQKKYGKILGVDPADLTNVELYELIDEWDDVPYKLGGVTKKGIDCSSFTQLIQTSIYNIRIERTAEAQFYSEFNDEFDNRALMFEGDLVFFTGVGSDNDKINHVGVYLHNNMFVHSTSNLDKNGKGGVQISNLNDNYWSTKFVAAGRQIIGN